MEKTELPVSESSGMIESVRLAQILDDMINEASGKKEPDIVVIPQNIEPEKKPSSDIDGIIVIPQNGTAKEEVKPVEEPVVEEPIVEEPVDEEPVIEDTTVEDEFEIEAEPEAADESEAIDEPEIAEESEVMEEPIDEATEDHTEISEELPPEEEVISENMSSGISRIAVIAPSGKEDTDKVERWCAKEFPDAEICSVKGRVNADEITENCGVVIAVTPKVTSYGAYRKVLKSLNKSQAKILGAVIV